MSARAASVIDWAVAGRPIPGETVSGDLHVAVDFPDGALVGVIDGLGHGREAAEASRAAAALLADRADEPVLVLIRACHEAMRSTRGAVMSLARIDAARGALSWAGVGNVEAVLNRADPLALPPRERILQRAGVVGYQLPPLRATELAIYPGDVLVFASDGLQHAACDEPSAGSSPADLAERLVGGYARETDDALALVARYRGTAA